MMDNSFLRPTCFVDSDNQAVAELSARTIAGATNDIEKAVNLFRVVRDSVHYDLYIDLSDRANYTASSVLESGRGFCVGKAALLAACARSVGVPARLGYADVRNHMTTPRMQELIGTDVFVWHSYAELWLGGRWIKATPAFNAALCDRVGVAVLEFDGRTDALFQGFDKKGSRYMEYLNYRGEFADVPFSTIVADFRSRYPRLMAMKGFESDFGAEVISK